MNFKLFFGSFHLDDFEAFYFQLSHIAMLMPSAMPVIAAMISKAIDLLSRLLLMFILKPFFDAPS